VQEEPRPPPCCPQPPSKRGALQQRRPASKSRKPQSKFNQGQVVVLVPLVVVDMEGKELEIVIRIVEVKGKDGPWRYRTSIKENGQNILISRTAALIRKPKYAIRDRINVVGDDESNDGTVIDHIIDGHNLLQYKISWDRDLYFESELADLVG
jgi:hypothetical protein